MTTGKRFTGEGTHLFPLYHIVADCEQEVIEMPRQPFSDFQLQAEEVVEEAYISELISKVLAKHKESATHDSWIVDLLESFVQLLFWSSKCKTKADIAASIALAYKLLTGRGVINTTVGLLSVETLQADAFSDLTKTAREWFTMGTDVLKNPLVERMRKIYTYLLVQGFLSRMGLNIGEEEFIALDKRARAKYSDQTSMVMLMIDTAIVICERIDAYRLTGDWSALVHDDATYVKWCKTADRLIGLAPFTSNLGAHGTTYFAFVADLNDAVEKGEAMCRYTSRNTGVDSLAIRRKLNTLQLLKNTEITRRASQKERKAPFGVLIHGTSSVAKSSFTKMLFYFYGQVHGLATDEHYRYVRNPAEEYWNNFDSSKWCIQLDDIAFMLPKKSADIDPTLKDLLNVVNNVPYVPPQAALEDKGKTPVMAECVLATSNASDLNASEYFHCPLAVRRRLPYIIHLAPKEEYKHENGKFIDPAKLVQPAQGFPDYWVITVQKLVPEEHNGTDSARLETVEVFTDVRKFLAHFGEKSKEHMQIQTRAQLADSYMRDIVVCPLCFNIKDECECVQALFVPAWALLVARYVAAEIGRVVYWTIILAFSNWIGMWLTKFYIIKHVTARVSRFLNAEREIHILGLLNGGRGYRFRVTMRKVAAVALVIGQIYVSWKFASFVQPKPSVAAKETCACPHRQVDEPVSTGCEEEPSEEEVANSGDHFLDLQGNIHGTTEEQLLKETGQNVWYNSAIELSQFDVPVASRSLATLSASGTRDMFAHNCVALELECRDVHFKYRVRGVFIKGQRLIFNRHALKNGTDFILTIVCEPTSCGITSNVTTYFKRHEVVELEEVDMVGLTVLDVPPRKDITKYWNVSAVPVSHMVGVSRTAGGSAVYTELYGVSFQPKMPIMPLDREMDVYLARGSEHTKDGDCGTLGIALTPRGPIILGLHTIGNGQVRGYPHITQTHLRKLLGAVPLIEGGGSPLFDLQGVGLQPGELHPRSVVRYLDRGVANVYGGLPGGRPRPRSRVCATPLQDVMLEELGCEVAYDRPVMTGWEPVHNNIKEMVLPHMDVDHDVVEHCVQAFSRDIITQLNEQYGDDWKRELVFLTDRAAVNGLSGVMYIDRINVNTSMGFPWNTTKKEFLRPDPSEDLPDGVTFTDEVWERVRHVEKCYEEGKRAYPVFTAHLKDEPTSFAKIGKKKTRVFTGAPIDFSIAGRKLLLSFVRLLQKNKLIFEAAPGTVTQSYEWTLFHEWLTQFGPDRLVAGDYGKFDKRMLARFILAAFEVIIDVHRAAGFDEDELKRIRAMGYDIAFPVCNFSGDIIEFLGTNPSGHPFTVIVNSLVNSLYMRYAFCKLNPEGVCWDFRKSVALLTYGDDNAMGVSPQTPWFNHTAVQTVLATIGVEYTMADKEAASVPYIHIQDVSFLKRKWRWDQELQAYAAPLDLDSIQKSLTVWVPSRTIDKYKQMVDVITSANSEYFFHGRELFERRRSFFQRVLEQEPYSHYVGDSTLPDWDTLVERFRQASKEFKKVPVSGLGHGSPTSLDEQSGNTETEEKSVETVTRNTVPAHTLKSACVQSNETLFQLQAEEVTEEVNTSTPASGLEMTSETVTFIDNAEGEVIMAGSEINPIAKVDGTEDLQLGRFLGRPTAIHSFTWNTADTIGVKATILPWHLFLNNTNIRKKIDNFAFLRGKMHIKVMVNGTPFQYGLLRTCYSPLLGLVSDKIRPPPSGSEPLLTPYSQQPGFFVTPAANAGGQMELPFFYHKNWLDITSAVNVQNFGTINFVIFAPLGVAVSGGSSAVTVQVFAWMTDVELMGSTASLALQGDEYDEGIVSRPASAVANVASYLTKVPVIGPFARATEIGARAVGSIAKIFGFTNVPVIANVHGFQPMNAPMLASGHIGTAVQKFSLDPKQELSLDPTLHGLHSGDELSIPYIKKKESYVGSGTWATTDAVNTLIWCCRINPAMCQAANIVNSVPTTVGQRVYHTPLSYTSQMFYNWRGSLVVRIKIVATKFHKGRLKISYDPRADITSTNPDVNVVYTKIVDIGEEDDIEIEIPYHQDTPWLLVDKSLAANWNTTGALPNRTGTDNGVLTVRVLTTLTAPAAGAIKVLAFTQGGDDFEYANPSDHIGAEGTNRVPSFFALQAEDITSVTPTRHVLGEKSVPHPDRYAQNFGEAINSLRCIAHRYMTMDTIWTNSMTADTATIVAKVLRIMPYTPGFDPNWTTFTQAAKVLSAGQAPYAFNTMSHMAYIAGMFMGYRGGANFVLTPGYDAYGSSISDFRVTRWTQQAGANGYRLYQNWASQAASGTLSARTNFVNRGSYWPDGLAGMAITNTDTNGSISFQLPDFKLANFSLVDPVNYVNGSSEDGTDRQAAFVQLVVKAPAGTNTSYLTMQTQISAAPDWTCLFWLCCPTLDYLTGNPTPI